jgi:hypothetical protein
VVPTVTAFLGHAVQEPEPAAGLKVFTLHIVQPVFADVQLPVKPAAHTQPACPVALLVVDPALHAAQVPEPPRA